MSDLQEFIRDTKELRAKVRALEAENAALRAALEKMTTWSENHMPSGLYDEYRIVLAEHIATARALLEEKP